MAAFMSILIVLWRLLGEVLAEHRTRNQLIPLITATASENTSDDRRNPCPPPWILAKSADS